MDRSLDLVSVGHVHLAQLASNLTLSFNPLFEPIQGQSAVWSIPPNLTTGYLPLTFLLETFPNLFWASTSAIWIWSFQALPGCGPGISIGFVSWHCLIMWSSSPFRLRFCACLLFFLDYPIPPAFLSDLLFPLVLCVFPQIPIPIDKLGISLDFIQAP